jgi:NTE family protein
MTDGPLRRVAIACQGGGSHTAFTAGVLARLFDGDELDGCEVVGLSGTSGGAICALLAWSALREGDKHKARALLDGFWEDNSASSIMDAAVNAWMVWVSTLQGLGMVPVASPYDLPVNGLQTFRDLLSNWVDFDRIDVDTAGEHPLLLMGAVDVLSGQFRAFHSRRDRITADMVLASAAIPTVFPTVHTDGGAYWDGLFSQNPPVRDLLETKPDELWVIQINPTARATEPRSVLDITDRRNELAGNLSLYQELHVIELIDRLLAEGQLVGDKYKQVVVRVLEFSRPRSSKLMGPSSKLNRDARFIRSLMVQGERQAEEFLAARAFEDAWQRGDADEVLKLFAPDVELTSTKPFRVRMPLRGQDAHDAVRELCNGVRLDLTHKQLTRERAVWTVRLNGSASDAKGRIEAAFDDGRVVRVQLGPVAQ